MKITLKPAENGMIIEWEVPAEGPTPAYNQTYVFNSVKKALNYIQTRLEAPGNAVIGEDGAE